MWLPMFMSYFPSVIYFCDQLSGVILFNIADKMFVILSTESLKFCMCSEWMLVMSMMALILLEFSLTLEWFPRVEWDDNMLILDCCHIESNFLKQDLMI